MLIESSTMESHVSCDHPIKQTNVGTACLEDFDSLMGTCRKKHWKETVK
jgi:hypothetical protein